MNKSAKIIISLVVLLIIVLGAVVIAGHKNNDTTTPTTNGNSSPSQTTNNTQQNNNATQTSTVAATISYTDSGFEPASISVKTGDTVKITNKSNRPLQFDSDPHPAHTDETELNVGTVSSGESMTFKVTKSGSWGYHNHLNPGDRGTIEVQ